MTKLICQKWEESERGWGVRPDGYSIHASMDNRDTYIRLHNDAMPEEIQDEYSRPSGTPYKFEATDEQWDAINQARVKDVPGVRVHDNNYPGDGGTDGFKHIPMPDGIEWDRDPAASGWRSRAFLDDGWQLIVYDEGDWSIRKNNEPLIQGKETSAAAGKARAIKIHAALIGDL